MQLSVNNLSYSYINGVRALTNVDIQISSGEFVLLSGPNGGGKSTLLQAILGILYEYYGGKITGEITFGGKSVKNLGIKGLAGRVGFVLQDPGSQVCNLTVIEEATAALCNFLYPKKEVISRSRDALKLMHLENLENVSVDTLSGGQLQRLAIASLLALRPKILILDEPLANIDPEGVADVIDALKEIKKSVDIVIVATHWLDPFLELATRLIVLDSGKVTIDTDIEKLPKCFTAMKKAKVEVPHVMQIQRKLAGLHILTRIVKGKIFLPANVTVMPVKRHNNGTGKDIVNLNDVFYRYPDGTLALKDITAVIKNGVRVAIIGHNGSGKSTLARLAAGLRKQSKGKIQTLASNIAMMPQKPGLGFITTTVADEIAYGTTCSAREVAMWLERFDLSKYKDTSPFQLSGGEQRRLSLAIATVRPMDLLILDEPTAGLDAQQVQFFEEILSTFTGASIYITHDPRIMGSFVQEVIVLKNGAIQFSGHTSDLTSRLYSDLGYASINPTVALAMHYLSANLPTSPSQLEVQNASSI